MKIIRITPQIVYYKSVEEYQNSSSEALFIAMDVENEDTYKILTNVENHSDNLNLNSISKRLTNSYLSKFVNFFSENMISVNPYGKPYLENTNIKYNVSHSSDKYALLISKNIQVGVDIEKISAKKRVLKIAERFFSANEFEYLSSLKSENLIPSFFEMWSLKESLVKCIGFQMFGNMDKIDTLNNIWNMDANTQFSNVSELYCMNLDMDKSFKISLSFDKPISMLGIYMPL